MLRTHYRHPIDWTTKNLDESHEILWDWAGLFEKTQTQPTQIAPRIVECLLDDLNTPQLIAELHSLRRSNEFGALRASLQFLGISDERNHLLRNRFLKSEPGAYTLTGYPLELKIGLSDAGISQLIEERNTARKARNFKEADRIRDVLADHVVLKDNPDGTTSWEPKR
jgi:cysteinyl-tRNA synthetase